MFDENALTMITVANCNKLKAFGKCSCEVNVLNGKGFIQKHKSESFNKMQEF